MARLHLPADHTDADLAVAGTLASLLESDELYVTWSQRTGCTCPVVPAAPEPDRDTPAHRRPSPLGRVLDVLRRLLTSP